MFLSVLFMAAFFFFSFAGSQEVVDRIAAVVNEYVITLSDVKIAASFNLYEEEILSQEKNNFEVLDWLVNQKLVIGMTQESISIEPEAVEAAYQSLLNKLGEETVKARLDSFGLKKEDLQDYLFEKIHFQRIIEDRFGLAVRVSLKEIEEFYSQKFVPAQKAKNIEPLPILEALEEIESAIKKDKINILVKDWLNNLRREADIQILLKKEKA